MKPLNFDLINEIIQKYYDYYPQGNNFYDTVNTEDYLEKEATIKFLTEKEILIPWGTDGKVILSDIGIDIVDKHKGVENYILFLKKKAEKERVLKEAENQSILYQAKLAKWQVKSFWYIFGLAVFGGLYSLYSIIQSFIK